MRIDVYVPFVITALLAAGVPRLAPRLIPRHAAWALTCVALVTAVGWLGSLSLLAFTALAQIPEVAQEGRWSALRLRAEDPVDFTVAVGCSLALALTGLALVVAAVRQTSEFRWARREGRLLPGDTELALIDDPSPEAFALAAKPARIVVSRGMLDCLDDGERAALLAHERAHLRGRHHLFRALWRLAAAVNPLLRPLVGAGRFTLERWADEDAAASVGDRAVVARAVARAALAATASRRSRPDLLAATGGAIPQRVESLLAPAPRARSLPFVVGGLLLALCCVSLVQAASDSEQMVDLAQHPTCAAPARPHATTSDRRPSAPHTSDSWRARSCDIDPTTRPRHRTA
jgi:hypothetical protein